jgi:hypothetical protein
MVTTHAAWSTASIYRDRGGRRQQMRPVDLREEEEKMPDLPGGMPRSSFTEGGPVYSDADLTVFIEMFRERFRAIDAQLALISDKLGIPYERPDNDVPQEVVELYHAGKRMEAVARYRQLTNASLGEARDALSRL